MSTTRKLEAGGAMPAIAVPKVGGGEIAIGNTGAWQMVVIYRGKHCPICRSYLKGLDGLYDDFRAGGTEVVAVSGDPEEKAESEAAEEGWHFPVGYGLTTDQMRQLGLYISEPRSPQETDRPFPEPGLFVINPMGQAHIIDVSNAPFARPDLKGVLNGLKIIRSEPTRSAGPRLSAGARMSVALSGIKACVFDAYGTLFDYASAAARCRDVLGDRLDAVNALWREKQLQYTWLRALQGRHADFWQVTGTRSISRWRHWGSAMRDCAPA